MFQYLPLIDPLIQTLMGAEAKRLNEMKLDLIRRNQEEGGDEHGFLFIDMYFLDRPRKYLRGVSLKGPQKGLTDDALFLYDAVNDAQRDEQKLRQSLTVVLSKCKSSQDVRDVLPEVFIGEISSLRGMKRTRPEGYLLEEYPMLKSQYKKAIEIAEYYTVNKILF